MALPGLAWCVKTVLAKEVTWGGGRHGPAGRGYGFAARLCSGHFQVQAEEEGEGVFAGVHAVGGADGGVEGGVGVTEAVGTGGFEGAIESAQGPAVGGRELAVGTPKVSVVRSDTCSTRGLAVRWICVHIQSLSNADLNSCANGRT